MTRAIHLYLVATISLVSVAISACGPMGSHLFRDRYTVTATLQAIGTGPVTACRIVHMSVRVVPCQGIPIRNLRRNMLNDVSNAPGGFRTRGFWRVVGNWDGTGLALTESPSPAAASDASRVWLMRDVSSGARLSPSEVDAIVKGFDGGGERQALESQGIVVLDVRGSIDDGLVDITVAAPTQNAMAYLNDHYPSARIYAWLKAV